MHRKSPNAPERICMCCCTDNFIKFVANAYYELEWDIEKIADIAYCLEEDVEDAIDSIQSYDYPNWVNGYYKMLKDNGELKPRATNPEKKTK